MLLVLRECFVERGKWYGLAVQTSKRTVHTEPNSHVYSDLGPQSELTHETTGQPKYQIGAYPNPRLCGKHSPELWPTTALLLTAYGKGVGGVGGVGQPVEVTGKALWVPMPLLTPEGVGQAYISQDPCFTGFIHHENPYSLLREKHEQKTVANRERTSSCHCTSLDLEGVGGVGIPMDRGTRMQNATTSTTSRTFLGTGVKPLHNGI